MRNHSLPLIITRLELLSPDSGEVIAYNLLLPNSSKLLMGPLGGIVLDPAFMAVDAVWREALVSSIPFYRLLYAYRMEAACLQLRTVMRSALKNRGLNVRLPPEYLVDAVTLVGLGMPMADVTQLKTVRDPGLDNYDMTLQKSIRLHDKQALHFRVEGFNLFNHAQFFGPASVDGRIEDPNFGAIISASAPRLIQVAAKFSF